MMPGRGSVPTFSCLYPPNHTCYPSTSFVVFLLPRYFLFPSSSSPNLISFIHSQHVSIPAQPGLPHFQCDVFHSQICLFFFVFFLFLTVQFLICLNIKISPLKKSLLLSKRNTSAPYGLTGLTMVLYFSLPVSTVIYTLKNITRMMKFFLTKIVDCIL